MSPNITHTNFANKVDCFSLGDFLRHPLVISSRITVAKELRITDKELQEITLSNTSLHVSINEYLPQCGTENAGNK